MRKGPALLSTFVLLAGCGDSSVTGRGCTGLPTAAHTRQFLVLFGALSRFTKRDVCKQFGAPQVVKQASGGREIWTYGSIRLTFKDDHVVTAGGKAQIGG